MVETIIRHGVKSIATLGVNYIFIDAVTCTTRPNAPMIKKIIKAVGGIALSGMVCEKVRDYVDDKLTISLKKIKEEE